MLDGILDPGDLEAHGQEDCFLRIDIGCADRSACSYTGAKCDPGYQCRMRCLQANHTDPANDPAQDAT